MKALIHLEIDPEDIPDNLKLLRVQMPDDASIRTLVDLPDQWEDCLAPTRSLGDAWLAQGQSLLLSVPSAIMPHTHNALFNPQHPQAAQASLSIETLRLDRRFLKGR